MSSAKKFVITIGAEYEGKSELKDLQTDLKAIAQIDSFEKLQASSKKAEAALKLARKQAYELGQAMMQGGGAEAERKYAAAVKQVDKLTIAFGKQKGKVYEAEAAFKKQGIALTDLTGKYKTLKNTAEAQGKLIAAQMALGVRPIKNIHSEIDGLKAAYKHLQTSGTQSVKELAIAKDRLRTKVAALRQETNGWTSHLSRIQTGWAGILATAGAVAAAYRGIQFFAGFDDSMREVEAFTQASSGEMQKFTDLAKNLGATTRFTATEVAQGMAELTQSGIKSYKELAGILPQVTDLTSASGMQFKETADMLTDTMKQFGLATSESGRVADVIAKGYTSAGHSAQQLGAALSYVGPVAKQMGYSLEDTVAIIDTLAEAGYKGQRGGTALRGGFTRLIKPVGDAAAVLQKYSIQVEDSEGNIRGFADIIEDLGDASLTTKEMMILFGQEAGPGMMALVDQGADAIREFQVAMENADGTVKAIAGTMEAGIGGSLRSLMSSLQAIVVGFGDALAPAIQLGADGLTLLSRGLAILPKPMFVVAAMAGTMGTAFAAWHLGFKHIHSAMVLASVDLISFAGKAKIATMALITGARQMTVALLAANPVLGALAIALAAGAAAWAIFGKSSLESSKEHAAAADKIGEARAAIDKEVIHLEKLQKTLAKTAEGTREHADAEAELSTILPGANLSLDEQGRIMVRVGEATDENSRKLQTYIDLKKEESRTQFALQIEQQAKAYFKAGEAVDKYKDNLAEWYGIGKKNTSVVHDIWRGLNRLTGTYDKNIQKGSEMRSNLSQQKTGYESLLKSLLRTGTTTEQVSEMLSSIHMDEGTKSKIISQYKTMYSGVTATGKKSATEIRQATEESMSAQATATKEKLLEMKAAYDSYAEQVKSIQKQIADREQSLTEKIRSMQREGMSDLGAWKDRKAEAYEYEQAAVKAAQAAEDAMSNGDTDEANALFKQAVEYADKAKSAYADLNGEVKKGDKVLISSDKARKASMAGVEDASKLAIDILKKQKAAAEAAQSALNLESDVDLSKPIDAAITKLDEMIKAGNKMEKDLKKNINGFGAEAQRVIDEIDKEIAKPRTMNITVQQSQASRLGGIIGSPMQALRLGGAVMMAGGGALGNALNGFHFPGYGGGDRRHVIAEDGEVMLRKEAVAGGGLTAALAFNAKNWPLVISELTKRFSLKMQTGGHVGSFGLPTLPTLALQSGGQVSAPQSMGHYTVDITNRNTGKTIPVMTSSRQNAEDLIREIQLMGDLAA